jgi:hypothetical protein
MSQIKIAILYTGEVRTIETVINYFVKNVLINENIHVFATVNTNNEDYIQKLIYEKMGENLKSVKFFNQNDLFWNQLQDSLLDNINVPPSWKHYLKTSGSMIQYYQLYLSYLQMVQVELRSATKYDFIMKIRSDIVITQPLNFNFLNMTEDIILQKLNIIAENTNDPIINSKKNITIFMNSLLHPYRNNSSHFSHNYINDTYNNSIIESNYDDELSKILTYNASQINEKNNKPELLQMISNFIRRGNYMLSFRKDIVYFMNRLYLDNISILGVTYGQYNLTKNDSYWFNAECQLQSICIKNNLHIFETSSDQEESSLFSYEEKNYFDDQLNLIDNKNVFWFIKRQ